jgi:DNA-binding NarL/FixJ family response regulator
MMRSSISSDTAAIADSSAAPQPVIRVLLADDHDPVRHAFATFLNAETDLLVVGHATNGQEALDQVRLLVPDVVLMDAEMPVMNGVAATRAIRAMHQGVSVIGLSMHEASDQAKAMLEAGAVGYVSKTEEPGVLLDAIRKQRTRSTACFPHR